MASASGETQMIRATSVLLGSNAWSTPVDPESRVDQRMVNASAGKHLVYHSAPFDADLEISGFFKLSAWIAIDQPDTDFRAAVYEIDPDGRALLMTDDRLRARYRDNARKPRLLRSTQPLRYDFEGFLFTSRLIEQRHRLRLVIGPINSIYSQKNFNSGVRVYYGIALRAGRWSIETPLGPRGPRSALM